MRYRQCIAEGIKIVEELYRSYSSHIAFICLAADLKASGRLMEFPGAEVYEISTAEYKSLSGQVSPEGVLAVVDFSIFNRKERTGFLSVYLDGIKDPGNLGSIIRTCDWFGVRQLFLSPDSVDMTNEKVIRASMGSIWRQAIDTIGEEELQDESYIKRYSHVYAADMNGKSIKDIQLLDGNKTEEEFLLVIGSESHGVRIKLPGMELISIPGETEMESLNASISAAILIAWFSLS